MTLFKKCIALFLVACFLADPALAERRAEHAGCAGSLRALSVLPSNPFEDQALAARWLAGGSFLFRGPHRLIATLLASELTLHAASPAHPPPLAFLAGFATVLTYGFALSLLFLEKKARTIALAVLGVFLAFCALCYDDTGLLIKGYWIFRWEGHAGLLHRLGHVLTSPAEWKSFPQGGLSAVLSALSVTALIGAAYRMLRRFKHPRRWAVSMVLGFMAAVSLLERIPPPVPDLSHVRVIPKPYAWRTDFIVDPQTIPPGFRLVIGAEESHSHRLYAWSTIYRDGSEDRHPKFDIRFSGSSPPAEDAPFVITLISTLGQPRTVVVKLISNYGHVEAFLRREDLKPQGGMTLEGGLPIYFEGTEAPPEELMGPFLTGVHEIDRALGVNKRTRAIFAYDPLNLPSRGSQSYVVSSIFPEILYMTLDLQALNSFDSAEWARIGFHEEAHLFFYAETSSLQKDHVREAYQKMMQKSGLKPYPLVNDDKADNLFYEAGRTLMGIFSMAAYSSGMRTINSVPNSHPYADENEFFASTSQVLRFYPEQFQEKVDRLDAATRSLVLQSARAVLDAYGESAAKIFDPLLINYIDQNLARASLSQPFYGMRGSG